MFDHLKASRKALRRGFEVVHGLIHRLHEIFGLFFGLAALFKASNNLGGFVKIENGLVRAQARSECIIYRNIKDARIFTRRDRQTDRQADTQT